MTRRRAYANVIVLLLLGALAVPTLAGADSGGASVGSSQASGANGVQPGDVTSTVSGDGITFSARVSALLRHELRFTGTVPARQAEDRVVLERLDPRAGWLASASTTVARNGSFTASWRTNETGRFPIRVVLAKGGGSRSGGASSSRVLAGSPTLEVTVYRPAIATIFGPAFYGQTTACGQTLRPHTLGVANRSLPCGTKVAIYYHGQTLVVPVIDRGPYANHADWDLTEATARELHMSGTDTIGAAALHPPR